MLEYIPDLGGPVWHANNWQMQGTWKYDPKKNEWANLKANGGGKEFDKEAPEPEQVGYYDPARKMLIVHRHKSTHHYDVKANLWKKVLSFDKDSAEVPYGHDAGHCTAWRTPNRSFLPGVTGLYECPDFTSDCRL